MLYLEPQDQRNQRALGFDMYASQPRREAMDRARDSGQPALSGRVELVQEQGRDRQSGFLIYEPIYRGGRIPTSVEERRAALVGFIYAPFRAGDLLRAVLYSAASEGLDYAVYDGEPGSDTLLHQSASQTASGGQAIAVRSLDIAGRPWIIVYRAQKDFEPAADGRLTLLFGVGGLLATLLLTLAVWRQGQARLRAEREVAARIAAEARQKLLLDELNHRVKNTLATVQSIAAQSLRKDRDLERVRQAFEARLVALSQAHNLLTRDNWTGANLAELLDCELAPYADAEGERVVLHGEPVWLTANVAVALGIAFHELATNALKYGALSTPGGRVRVQWTLEPPGGDGAVRWLRIVWREQGGPPVRPPQHRGFGTRVVVGGLTSQLDGEVALDFAPGGLTCVIAFPVPAAANAQMMDLGSVA